jgi:hypothetical protein
MFRLFLGRVVERSTRDFTDFPPPRLARSAHFGSSRRSPGPSGRTRLKQAWHTSRTRQAPLSS